MEPNDRGILETNIDSAILAIPQLVPFLKESLPKELSVKQFTDFVLGYAFGYIAAAFRGSYLIMHNQAPSPQITVEAIEITNRRAREIAAAIFNTG